jgi:hypothetical protein
MHIVEVLSQPRNSIDSRIGNVTALGKNKVTESRGYVDDLLNRTIRKTSTTGKVKDTKMLIDLVRGERQECRILDQFAVCKAKFAEGLSLS